MNTLRREKQIQIVAALTGGCSIRSVERLTDTHRDSIMRLGVRVGEGCVRLHDAMMRNLHVNLLELDEQWSFIQKKAKRVQPGDNPEAGDCYLHIALDATSKAVVSYLVGKRSHEYTMALAADLRARIVNRPQITSDGWPAYPDAIEQAFGTDCDFATIVKDYATTPGNEAAVRYSPGKIRGCEKTVVLGNPDPSAISTSYVERFNLSTRMQSRRFTRLTNAFSKKLRNHKAAIALYVAWYNLCRVHESLRCTPAMALGVTDHIRSIGELVSAALSATEPTPIPTPIRPRGMSASEARYWQELWIGSSGHDAVADTTPLRSRHDSLVMIDAPKSRNVRLSRSLPSDCSTTEHAVPLAESVPIAAILTESIDFPGRLTHRCETVRHSPGLVGRAMAALPRTPTEARREALPAGIACSCPRPIGASGAAFPVSYTSDENPSKRGASFPNRMRRGPL